MQNRRTFLKQSSAVALASMAFGPVSTFDFLGKKHYVPGVQLYTLMSVIDNDTKGTLKKLADIGYKNIESAFSKQGGFYGKTAPEFAAMLKDLGLKWRSHHVIGAPFKLPPDVKLPTDENGNPIKLPVMKNLKENMQELVDSVAGGGIEYLVCANIPTNTPEEVADAVQILTKTGEACKKAGLKLVYHNHDWEFKTVGTSRPFDVFQLFKENPGRFPLWHVKDIASDHLTLKPVGDGSIDFKRIFKHAKTAGLVYPMIEHDQPADAFDSLSRSMAYLKKNIL
jgi:sugar phosphate isomerase/epimerase